MPTSDVVKLEFRSLGSDTEDTIAVLRLNRPAAANAFNATMLDDLTERLLRVAKSPHCRILILTANGKHFSAGADLAWMQAAAKLSYEENLTDASRLIAMFEALISLPIPTVCLAQGAAYGGALGLIACCDVTIAHTDSRFSLSEVRLGLLPAVIYPYLARRMLQGALRRYSLTGQVFSSTDAKLAGLIDVVTESECVDDVLRNELNHLLLGGRMAHAQLKLLHTNLREQGFRQSPMTQEAIAKARTGKEGQAGLNAFFKKEKPPWVRSLPEGWTINAS